MYRLLLQKKKKKKKNISIQNFTIFCKIKRKKKLFNILFILKYWKFCIKHILLWINFFKILSKHFDLYFLLNFYVQDWGKLKHQNERNIVYNMFKYYHSPLFVILYFKQFYFLSVKKNFLQLNLSRKRELVRNIIRKFIEFK